MQPNATDKTSYLVEIYKCIRFTKFTTAKLSILKVITENMDRLQRYRKSIYILFFAISFLQFHYKFIWKQNISWDTKMNSKKKTSYLISFSGGIHILHKTFKVIVQNLIFYQSSRINPFVSCPDDLFRTKEEREFIDLKNDLVNKASFSELKLSTFWILLYSHYPESSTKAILALLPFGLSYFCELWF